MAWPVEMQREERSTVLGAFFTLFGMTAADSVTETARDALFLAQVPVKRLVWVYLAIAAILALVLLATMAFTTTDFLFKSSVAAHVRTADLGAVPVGA